MFRKVLIGPKRKIRKEEIYIPARFKLSYLTGLLGKPDFINDYSVNKVYKWENYGLEAESFSLSKGYVFRLTVKIHKTKYSSLSLNIAGIFHLNNKEIKPWDAGRKIKKNSIYSIFIRSLDNNQEYTCKKSEIQTIQVIFTLSPNKLLDAVYRADKHEIISLIKRGRDINRRSTGYCSPLMAAMRLGNLEIAKVLLVSLMIAAMPIKHWAQTPYRQYAEDGILLNFHEIDNVDFRVYLLYNLSQNHQFSMLADDEPGLVDTSTAGNLADGGSLVKNHLYMVTINGNGIRAVGTVKIVARGDYTIS